MTTTRTASFRGGPPTTTRTASVFGEPMTTTPTAPLPARHAGEPLPLTRTTHTRTAPPEGRG
ncbi:hypothetical protein [Streptomyces bacillaris]|uniref:hypothetical protein n=1 Tax=Streptomyces bacillaris TaxID=68179 RepID=UPI0038200085